ncbi:hypothetical protein ACET3Z_005747 [Daucus carota]
MEDKSTSNAIVVIHKKQNINGERNQKRFSFFKTAMVLLRNRPNKKPKVTKVSKCNDNSRLDGKWKRLVGSMRPLHMQDKRSTPPQSPGPKKALFSVSTVSERSEDEFFASSPSLSTTSWSTSSYASTSSLQDQAGIGTIKQSASSNSLRKMSDNMSRYASSLNLHDFDMDEEIEEDIEDDDDNVLEKCEADNMIDTKADEFIAKFYQQMRSQQ